MCFGEKNGQKKAESTAEVGSDEVKERRERMPHRQPLKAVMHILMCTSRNNSDFVFKRE